MRWRVLYARVLWIRFHGSDKVTLLFPIEAPSFIRNIGGCLLRIQKSRANLLFPGKFLPRVDPFSVGWVGFVSVVPLHPQFSVDVIHAAVSACVNLEWLKLAAMKDVDDGLLAHVADHCKQLKVLNVKGCHQVRLAPPHPSACTYPCPLRLPLPPPLPLLLLIPLDPAPPTCPYPYPALATLPPSTLSLAPLAAPSSSAPRLYLSFPYFLEGDRGNVCQRVYLLFMSSVCLFVCLSVYLSVCLSVCFYR